MFFQFVFCVFREPMSYLVSLWRKGLGSVQTKNVAGLCRGGGTVGLKNSISVSVRI